MKNKDIIILKKIIEYCDQVEEACEMFQNDYDKFVGISVFQNACCMCVLQIGELCKVVSKELREREVNIPWREWCGISLTSTLTSTGRKTLETLRKRDSGVFFMRYSKK